MLKMNMMGPPMPRSVLAPRTAMGLGMAVYGFLIVWLLVSAGCAGLNLEPAKSVEDRLLYAASQRTALIQLIAAKQDNGSLSGERLTKAVNVAKDLGSVIRAGLAAVKLKQAVLPEGCVELKCNAAYTPEDALKLALTMIATLEQML